jgi:TolB-like protein
MASLPTADASSTTSTSPPATPPRLSIVVLPFVNLSNDPDRQHFADGVTGDLTTSLSRIPDMLVISRNTAFTYRDKPVDTKQIGRDLGVRYVLEGEVQHSGNRVRVTAQLIDAETDTLSSNWRQRARSLATTATRALPSSGPSKIGECRRSVPYTKSH